MSSPSRIVLAALLVLAARPATASAQYFLSNGYSVGLVELPQYRADIPLDDAKIERLKKASEATRKAISVPRATLAGLSEEEQRAAIKVRNQDAADLYEKELKAILTPVEVKRVRQISLHGVGPHAFRVAFVRQSLKLTDEQRKAFDEIEKRTDADRREISAAMRDPKTRAEIATRARKLDAETMDRYLALLTDEQKTAWTELLGPKPAAIVVRPQPPGRPK